MAVGVPSGKVEIEWTSGTWTDVTSYVAFDQGMTGTFGRQSQFDDVSAGTWQVILRNDDGRFTPNNPLSPYYPFVVENARLRVSITAPGGSTYVRFLGYLTAITPTFPDGGGYSGLVTVQAADVLAAMNRRMMASGWVEEAQHTARFFGGWCDAWSFTGTTSPTIFQNIGEQGILTSALTGTATILSPPSGNGQWAVNNVTGAMADASLDLTPAGTVGPVLQIVPTTTFQCLDFFVKIPTQTQLAYANGSAGLCLADFQTSNGQELFSLRVARAASGNAYCDMYYYTTAGLATTLSSIPGSLSVDTDVWFKISLTYYAAGQILIVFNDTYPAAIIPYDLTSIKKITFGGYMGSMTGTKQSLCLTMSLAGVILQGTNNSVPKGYILGTPTADWDEHRWRELASYGSKLYRWRRVQDFACTAGSPVITSATANFSTDDVGAGIQPGNPGATFTVDSTIISVQSPTQATMSNNASTTVAVFDAVLGPVRTGPNQAQYGVSMANPSGQTLGAFLQTFARTIGGAVWVNNAGFPTFITSEDLRLSTPLCSVSVEDDAIGTDLELTRSIDQAPTRVTVNSPIGSVVVVDTVAEAAGYRVETSIDTHCYRYMDLQSVGSYWLSGSKALRFSRLTIELSTARNNLYAALFAGLQPGVRLRVTDLPTAIFGFSWVDVYVQGWTETYSSTSVTMVFDCSPADAPTEGSFDDAEYGRFAADKTLNVAYPLTSSATSIAIAPSEYVLAGSPVMTTQAADYPLDLDVLGERVTLPAVPTTSTRTNLCTNPSFASATSWSGSVTGFTAATIASSTTFSFIGPSSLKVSWPTAAAGASAVGYTLATTAGTTYSFSVWVYVPRGCPDVKIAALVGSPTSVTYSPQTSTGTNNAWVRLGMTFTASTTSTTIGVVTTAASTSGVLAYLDNALIEAASSVGSYFDGTYAGSWTGTVNASTSTQTIQNYTGVTRGVAPSVARSHLAGEDVDVWHAAAFSL